MPYAYPTSDQLNVSEGIFGTLFYIQNVTDGWFFNLVLIGLYLISSMTYYKTTKDFPASLAVSGFFCFVSGLFLWLTGVLDDISFTFVVGIMIISTLIFLITKEY